MNKPDPKYIGNVVYKAGRLSLIVIGVTWVAVKLKIIKDIDVGKLDVKDMAKLGGMVSGGIFIDDQSVKAGLWPGDLPV